VLDLAHALEVHDEAPVHAQEPARGEAVGEPREAALAHPQPAAVRRQPDVLPSASA